MKHRIHEILDSSLKELANQKVIALENVPNPLPIEHSRRSGHGDFATSVALVLAKPSGKNPRELAELIQKEIPDSSIVEKTEIAGPGFINFFLTDRAYSKVVPEILEKKSAYGVLKPEQPQKILVEFVSANPTGPLHVGHGRGAAVGDSLAKILSAAGHQVDTEYYVNDIGRQMNILGLSVWIRYLGFFGKPVSFPKGAYQGEYVSECARELRELHGEKFLGETEELFQDLPDEPDDVLDRLIEFAKNLLGSDNFSCIRRFALDSMVKVIQSDLEAFDVEHKEWFFESQVVDSKETDQAVSCLVEKEQIYEADGALWFRSTEYGDEKDRVVIRSNGELTYFATDIAYHLNKFKRGYNKMINIWGADHHGYIARMKGALKAAGEDSERLQILVVQLAALRRGSKKIALSTRAGDFVSLKELLDETGKDAARFFYVLRKPEQHLDFDLELAKSKSNENPVYYVQYAHARISSVFRQMQERGIVRQGKTDYDLLEQQAEVRLMKQLAQYPEIIESSAQACEPHQVAYYLREVANEFHSLYNKERILDCSDSLRNARLDLIEATRHVLANGLGLLGVAAPDSM